MVCAAPRWRTMAHAMHNEVCTKEAAAEAAAYCHYRGGSFGNLQPEGVRKYPLGVAMLPDRKQS